MFTAESLVKELAQALRSPYSPSLVEQFDWEFSRQMCQIHYVSEGQWVTIGGGGGGTHAATTGQPEGSSYAWNHARKLSVPGHRRRWVPGAHDTQQRKLRGLSAANQLMGRLLPLQRDFREQPDDHARRGRIHGGVAAKTVGLITGRCGLVRERRVRRRKASERTPNVVDGNPARNYQEMKKMPFIKSWTQVSTDVPEGHPPIVLDQGERG